MNEDKQKRPLAGLRGGRIEASGEPKRAELLRHALDVVITDGDGGLAGEYTHAFHSYPARFHPWVPRRLLAGEPDAARVLDPFVGSGTTMVEAVVAGRRAFGCDINPLAVMLSRVKATPRSPGERARLERAAAKVVDHAAETVRASRRKSSAQPEPPRAATRFDDPTLYPPHVFRELVTLRTTIDTVCAEPEFAVAGEPLRSALLLVLSSIVVKVSLQRSDTDPTLVERAIARGAATRLYAARAKELLERVAARTAAVPAGTPPPSVRDGDARRLGHIKDGTIDLVITSPPYLGTYDYAAHHARRFGWLGLDPSSLRAEIGARRDAGTALARWSKDVADYVAAIARVLSFGGRAYLLVGDSAVGTRAIAGDEELRAAAARCGLRVTATASQERPDVYAPARGQLDRPRREHLVALEKS